MKLDKLSEYVDRGLIRPEVAEDTRCRVREMLNKDATMDWKNLLLASTLAVATPAVAAAVQGGAERLYHILQKEKNFRSMLNENPDLQELDEVKVRKHFDTLVRFNPEFAGDPHISGSYMREVAKYGLMTPEAAKNIVDAHRVFQGTQPAPFSGTDVVRWARLTGKD